MSSKLITNKRTVNGMRSHTRTPIRTGSNSQTLKMCSRTPITTISFDEHKKVLTRNNTLARENASLREQIRLLKNENLNLKANQVNNDLPDSHQMFDTFAVSLNFLSQEYNTIKDKFDDLGMNVENVRRVLSDCSAQLIQSYPEFMAEYLRSNDEMNGVLVNNENNGMTTHDMNSRYSLSPQERESRRKLSLERIKQHFHVFSELSTILEQSKEQRSSSLIFGGDSSIRMSGKFNERMSLVSNQSNLKYQTLDVLPISEVDSDAENDGKDRSDQTKMTQNIDSNRIKPQKLPFRDSTNNQKMSRSSGRNSNSITNAVQVYDIQNKENIMPSIVPSNTSRFSLNILNLTHSQHSSPVKRINCVNNCNEVSKIGNTLMDMTLNDDFNENTCTNSSATVLVDESRDYRISLMEKRSAISLNEVMETPQMVRSNEVITERIRSDEEEFETEIIPVIDVVLDLNKSEIDLNSNNNQQKSDETKPRPKRSRRKSIQIVNYDESSELEKETDCEIGIKKRPKRKTVKTSEPKSEKPVVKKRKTKSQSNEETQQTQVKKKRKETTKENENNLAKRLSVYDFQEDQNCNTDERSVQKPKRTKTKKN